jgi:hypothetical protein
VHGEEEARRDFASLLKEKIESDIISPEYLQEYEL